MQKSDKNKKFFDNATIRLIKTITIISIVLSLMFVFILEKTKTYIAIFSDNLFISGTILFTISVLFNVIRRISIFVNRSYYGDNTKSLDKNKDIDSGDAVKDYKKKLFARNELYKIIYKASLISGIVCYILSIVAAIFYNI